MITNCRHIYGLCAWNDGVSPPWQEVCEWGHMSVGHVWKQEPVSRQIKMRMNEYRRRVNPVAIAGQQRWAHTEQINRVTWQIQEAVAKVNHARTGKSKSKIRNPLVYILSPAGAAQNERRFASVWHGALDDVPLEKEKLPEQYICIIKVYIYIYIF